LARAAIVARARIEGTAFVSRRLRLPSRLPPGYHTLELEGKSFSARSRLIVAPRQAWQPNTPVRSWGIFAPLYALHSSKGAGTYSTLGELMEWTAARGGGMLATLPLLSLFLPNDASPYSPISKLFWNEFYVDVKAVPEWAACEQASSRTSRKESAPWVPSELVDYSSEFSSKRALLEGLARFFFSKPSERRREFERWLNPEVQRYAAFRAIMDERAQSPSSWPQRLCQGQLKEGDFDPRVRDYHLYAQWLAQQQMTKLSARSRELGVCLYLDMPLGVRADGYDAWRHPELFASHASGGAPPDPVFTKGQDWGFAPLHPQQLRQQGYRYLIECVQHHLRHAGALRFDHVMSLHRLFWIPRGLSPAQGAYVAYPAEELYAILSLESHRYHSMIVGEDLGTVPPEVTQGLQRHGIRQMYVVQYELRPHVKRALRPAPVRTVASLNTHDMPPFAAFCDGLDIADRGGLGLLTKSHVLRDERIRRKMIQALTQFLRLGSSPRLGSAPVSARPRVSRHSSFSTHLTLFQACLAHLARSRAEWVLINMEDLWLETQPQNTPGTTLERVNWRRRTKLSLEELSRRPEIAASIAALQRARPSSRTP
jgi:4-alpha-glucanotransferase